MLNGKSFLGLADVYKSFTLNTQNVSNTTLLTAGDSFTVSPE